MVGSFGHPCHLVLQTGRSIWNWFREMVSGSSGCLFPFVCLFRFDEVRVHFNCIRCGSMVCQGWLGGFFGY